VPEMATVPVVAKAVAKAVAKLAVRLVEKLAVRLVAKLAVRLVAKLAVRLVEKPVARLLAKLRTLATQVPLIVIRLQTKMLRPLTPKKPASNPICPT